MYVCRAFSGAHAGQARQLESAAGGSASARQQQSAAGGAQLYQPPQVPRVRPQRTG